MYLLVSIIVGLKQIFNKLEYTSVIVRMYIVLSHTNILNDTT